MNLRDQYDSFIAQINAFLKQNELYAGYTHSILDGKNSFSLSQVYTKKNYTNDWIDAIEECLPSLDTIVRNPRKFIVIEEDIVDVSLARSISVESVKHLAQHTNLINSVKKDGTVIPSKILNTSKEESFEIYENRFIYTLLLKTKDFIDRRFETLKKALIQSGELGVEIKSEFHIDGHKVGYNLNSTANFPFDSVVAGNRGGQLSDTERLTRINMIFNDFLSSAFAKEMRSSAPVRPPIQRTNVILKDQNFKKALVLWQFVESNENMNFSVDTAKETDAMPAELIEKYRGLIFFNTVLMQSIAAAREEGEAVEIAIEKEKKLADEYVTKNIDDFVPDDFPHLKMELSEIRRIYYKIPGEKQLKLTEVSKMNAAIDRVVRQFKINTAKAESIAQQKLIEKQLKEEEEAKRIALREAREEERRKIQAERERVLLEKQLERERIEAARLAEIARIEEEKRRAEELIRLEAERIEAEKRAEAARIEAERLAEIERQKQEAERIEAERLADEARRREAEEIRLAAEKRAIEEAEKIAQEVERQMLEELERERIENEKRLKEEAETAARIVREQLRSYWDRQRELAVRLLSEEKTTLLTKEQKKSLKKLQDKEKYRIETIKKMTELLISAATTESEEEIARLLSEAKTFRSPEEVIKIKKEADMGIPSLSQLAAAKRVELLKAQYDRLKEALKKVKMK
ncbi:MAG: hypothetical protein LBU04_05165 [Christensenellaceae bacterium]|jgi:hypothetical protein|nr:hypothetical protein [Christensenellaceae bacterium]